ncbi:sugar transferase [Aggregatilinea lenta]|uniref:sugar transferase n=1 Tax=Aggregatilinea lenta TaxID=913108 RepID=UPI000E5B106D|nr:sugar transferase [Aggregatilinea lenta]
MLKRSVDLVGSALGLLLILPLMPVLAILIYVTSPGPILYRAQRVGRDGRPFTVYKFRSMVLDADRAGPGVTGAGDSRITSVGRFLRQTKLDELPQLFNVLRGDMSLVGPRPEDPRYVALYTPQERAVLTVRPGITSLASIRYRHEEALLAADDWETQYVHDLLPKKLQMDLTYVRDRSLMLDLRILMATLVALAQRKPA